MKNKKTLQEERIELQEAFRDLKYEFLKSLGLLWLIKKIPFCELKDWIKEREILKRS